MPPFLIAIVRAFLTRVIGKEAAQASEKYIKDKLKNWSYFKKLPENIKKTVFSRLGLNEVKKVVQEETSGKVKKAIAQQVKTITSDSKLLKKYEEVKAQSKRFYNQANYWKKKLEKTTQKFQEDINSIKKNFFEQKEKIENLQRENEELKRQLDEQSKNQGLKNESAQNEKITTEDDYLQIGFDINKELYEYYSSNKRIYRFRQGEDLVRQHAKEIWIYYQNLDRIQHIEDYTRAITEYLTDNCLA